MTSIAQEEALASDRLLLSKLQERNAPLHVLDLWSPLYWASTGSKLHADPDCPPLRGAQRLRESPAREGLRYQGCARCVPESRGFHNQHAVTVAERLHAHVEALLQAEEAPPELRFTMSVYDLAHEFPRCECEHHEEILREWRCWSLTQQRSLMASALRDAECSEEILAAHESRALAGAVGLALRRGRYPLAATAAWRDAYLAGSSSSERLQAAQSAEEAHSAGPLNLADLPRITEATFAGGDLHAWLLELAGSARAAEVAQAVAEFERILAAEEDRVGRYVLAGFSHLRSQGRSALTLDPGILVHYQPVVVGDTVFANLPVLLAEQVGIHCARMFDTARSVNLAGREEQLRLAAELWGTGLTLSQAWLAAGRALR